MRYTCFVLFFMIFCHVSEGGTSLPKRISVSKLMELIDGQDAPFTSTYSDSEYVYTLTYIPPQYTALKYMSEITWDKAVYDSVLKEVSSETIFKLKISPKSSFKQQQILSTQEKLYYQFDFLNDTKMYTSQDTLNTIYAHQDIDGGIMSGDQLFLLGYEKIKNYSEVIFTCFDRVRKVQFILPISAQILLYNPTLKIKKNGPFSKK